MSSDLDQMLLSNVVQLKAYCRVSERAAAPAVPAAWIHSMYRESFVLQAISVGFIFLFLSRVVFVTCFGGLRLGTPRLHSSPETFLEQCVGLVSV